MHNNTEIQKYRKLLNPVAMLHELVTKENAPILENDIDINKSKILLLIKSIKISNERLLILKIQKPTSKIWV